MVEWKEKVERRVERVVGKNAKIIGDFSAVAVI